MSAALTTTQSKRPEDTLLNTHLKLSPVAPLLVAVLLGTTAGHSAPPVKTPTSLIVQAADSATASRLVAAVDGTVTHELGIIRAVGARLTAAQRDRLAGMQGVLHLYENDPLAGINQAAPRIASGDRPTPAIEGSAQS